VWESGLRISYLISNVCRMLDVQSAFPSVARCENSRITPSNTRRRCADCIVAANTLPGLRNNASTLDERSFYAIACGGAMPMIVQRFNGTGAATSSPGSVLPCSDTAAEFAAPRAWGIRRIPPVAPATESRKRITDLLAAMNVTDCRAEGAYHQASSGLMSRTFGMRTVSNRNAGWSLTSMRPRGSARPSSRGSRYRESSQRFVSSAPQYAKRGPGQSRGRF